MGECQFVGMHPFNILKFGIRPQYILRKLQHTLPLEHAPDPQPAVYEGNPFIFWGT